MTHTDFLYLTAWMMASALLIFRAEDWLRRYWPPRIEDTEPIKLWVPR